MHCCTETRLEWHSYLMFSSVNPYNSVMRLHRVLEKAELTEWTPKTNVSNTACSDHRECWNTTQGEVHCCTETSLEWNSYLMFSSVNPYNSVMRLHRVLEKAELTEWTPKTNVSNTACSDHRECWNTTQGEVHCCTETSLEWNSYLMFSSVNPYNSVTRLHRACTRSLVFCRT